MMVRHCGNCAHFEQTGMASDVMFASGVCHVLLCRSWGEVRPAWVHGGSMGCCEWREINQDVRDQFLDLRR